MGLLPASDLIPAALRNDRPRPIVLNTSEAAYTLRKVHQVKF
jgi:hypothetical protein